MTSGHTAESSIAEFDDIVLYLADEHAVVDATRQLRANGVAPATTQHPYWNEWGGTTFVDPDGRKVIYVSWIYGPSRDY